MATQKRFVVKNGLDNASQTITNVANPVLATDAVNKQFLTPTNVGLSAVNNTSDINKPISTTQQSALDLKANIASPTFTGTPLAPTAANGTNTTQVATTAFVTTTIALKANLDSPTLTGTPTAPTAAAGTNTTQVATTAFVQSSISAISGSASPQSKSFFLS